MDLGREFLKNKTQVRISINGDKMAIEDIKIFNKKGLESYYRDYSSGQEIHTKYNDHDNIIYQHESPSEQRYWVYEDNRLSSYTSLIVSKEHPELFSLSTEVYEYDERGRKILILSSDGTKTVLAYDDDECEYKPSNEKTYFPNNKVTEKNNKYHYYSDGEYECHTEIIDSFGHVSKSLYIYDANDNNYAEVHFGDHRIFRKYDSIGNIVYEKYVFFNDPECEILEYEYVYNEYCVIIEEWCNGKQLSLYRYFDEDQHANPDNLPYA